MNADIIAEIGFYDAKDCSRIKSAPFEYRVLMQIDKVFCDCRIDSKNIESKSEKIIRCPVAFLVPDIVNPKIKIGTIFKLWEGGDIAEGVIIIRDSHLL